MRNFYYNILSIAGSILGLVLLLYFWLPLFFIVLLLMLISLAIALIVNRIKGNPSNFHVKVIKIKRSYSDNPTKDYIDTTTDDSSNKNQE
ncbi:MAG: hypothetical protein ACRCTQ_04300 [Brevinemataceae bacterium]